MRIVADKLNILLRTTQSEIYIHISNTLINIDDLTKKQNNFETAIGQLKLNRFSQEIIIKYNTKI